MTSDKIGRYIIISELGRGGMATVYRAKDPNFDREVAVKILPRTFLHDPQFRARFEREAKTVAALEHAAIVPVYDFGEEDGQPFIVMRLMSGGSLAEKLKEEKFSLEDTVRIVSHLAAGLDAAHKKGVIHRDLKPGNILFDQYGDPYLSDFGIARLTEGDGTLTGSRILGTPAYMSPEQIQGDKNIDNRSDIYAIGVIFYQMLVGNTPFQAATPAKVMMMHIMEPVPDIVSTLPNVPTSIKAWCEKVLAKDPDDRFSNAQEMGDALTAAMKNQVLPQQTVIASSWDEDATQQSRPIAAQTPQPQVQQPRTPTPTPQPQIPAIRKPSYVEPSSQPSVQGPKELYTPPPAPTKKKTFSLPVIMGAIIALGIGAVGLIYLVFSGLNGSGPLASVFDGSTPNPTTIVSERLGDTPVPTEQAGERNDQPQIENSSPTDTILPSTPTNPPPTPSPEPTLTPTQAAVVIGGADKIAFLNASEIWMVNIDGTDLQQLTNDGILKTNLGWLPDGSGVTYIAGKCISMVTIESLQVDNIACFETTEYLENFSFSPDGTQVAISVYRELYVVPFDLERLKNVRSNGDLKGMAECGSVGPLTTSTGTSVPVKLWKWANDGQRFVILKLANLGGQQGDLIQMFDLQSCAYEPIRLDEIPSSRFTLENYNKTPYIQNFGYDGDNLIALVSYTRNDGYGHLYIYNHSSYKVDAKINPINGECCYRDPQFSPDGRYLLFVNQPYDIDPLTQLYYVPVSMIGSGSHFDPIPMQGFTFDNPKEKPQPILRPAP